MSYIEDLLIPPITKNRHETATGLYKYTGRDISKVGISSKLEAIAKENGGIREIQVPKDKGARCIKVEFNNSNWICIKMYQTESVLRIYGEVVSTFLPRITWNERRKESFNILKKMLNDVQPSLDIPVPYRTQLPVPHYAGGEPAVKQGKTALVDVMLDEGIEEGPAAGVAAVAPVKDQVKDENYLKKEAYRYLGVIIKGSKMAAILFDGNYNIVDFREVLWENEAQFMKDRIMKPGKVPEVMSRLESMCAELIKENNVDPRSINQLNASFAGEVDESAGLLGTPMKTPNLPFPANYPIHDELVNRLKKYGITITHFKMGNSAEMSDQGEKIAGLLQDKEGVAFVDGKGIGSSAGEIGHYIVRSADGRHYLWLGDILEKYPNYSHPIERGNSRREIIRKSGEFGKEYLKLREKRFLEKYPEYPVIDWKNGCRDFEDTCSGPALEKWVKEQLIEQRKIPSKVNFCDNIERQAGLPSFNYVRALTPEAEKNNPVALELIREAAGETGRGLAVWIAAHPDDRRFDNIVLVGGVGEKFGKGVEEYPTKDHGVDIFIKHVRSSVKEELSKYGPVQVGLMFTATTLASTSGERCSTSPTIAV